MEHKDGKFKNNVYSIKPHLNEAGQRLTANRYEEGDNTDTTFIKYNTA